MNSKSGCWSAWSIKTRIETHIRKVCHSLPFYVEVHDPLKQGLKQFEVKTSVFTNSSWSAWSIKTRIETQYISYWKTFHRSWSAWSIKTRIETLRNYRYNIYYHNVEVHDPLKQGLKQLHLIKIKLFHYLVEVHDPLKQGLKLYDFQWL